MSSSERRANLRLVLPKTREFLLALYGGESNYVSYTVPKDNPHSLLETICMMYDHSFEFEYSAVKALEMLGVSPGSVCTLSGRCTNACGVRCGSNRNRVCGMDPKAQLHDELTRIISSREEVERYLRR